MYYYEKMIILLNILFDTESSVHLALGECVSVICVCFFPFEYFQCVCESSIYRRLVTRFITEYDKNICAITMATGGRQKCIRRQRNIGTWHDMVVDVMNVQRSYR